MSTINRTWGMDVDRALRLHGRQRGNTLADMTIASELADRLVEADRVRNYVESCVCASQPVNPEAVLRLLYSCHEDDPAARLFLARGEAVPVEAMSETPAGG
jgi:hypothetical protein